MSIMRLTEGLDSGPVCLAASEPIGPEDDYGALARRLERLGGDLLVRALDESPEFAEQDEAGATYAEKIGPDDRALDAATRPAAELERVVRALHPHIGARFGDLGVRRARVVADGPPAASLARDGERLLLGTPDGALELLVVQPPGGKPMEAAAYLRGHGLHDG